MSDYTEKNSNLIPKIDIPCFAWNSQAEQGLLFFKAKSLDTNDFYDLNEKLALKKLLTYMKSVYKIPQKIKCLTDERKRKSIPLFNIVMPVLLFLMLQSATFSPE